MVFTVSTVDFSGERSGGIPERFLICIQIKFHKHFLHQTKPSLL
ncbi:MAG: hypothetical protein EZS26_003987 [Candidatus Ordinivivax streblomastigis]|uniref:Uncharacterized protein n=1 Tax=Candidatus Ordinivivax streblomastigis TaxID=2540710 RepID=A0A5M8NRW8_9BACT|nr:MAG: hypothetical protein EZS26_003987 [Candidatus Ordinivivax streblomastigis]